MSFKEFIKYYGALCLMVMFFAHNPTRIIPGLGILGTIIFFTIRIIVWKEDRNQTDFERFLLSDWGVFAYQRKRFGQLALDLYSSVKLCQYPPKKFLALGSGGDGNTHLIFGLIYLDTGDLTTRGITVLLPRKTEPLMDKEGQLRYKSVWEIEGNRMKFKSLQKAITYAESNVNFSNVLVLA